MWLLFVLCFRILAASPTIWQSSKYCFYVHHSSGVEERSFSDSRSLHGWPDGAWCLVDSNLEVLGVRETLMNSNAFIVQAASLRIDHMKWSNKRFAFKYLMKPWSLAELIVG